MSANQTIKFITRATIKIEARLGIAPVKQVNIPANFMTVQRARFDAEGGGPDWLDGSTSTDHPPKLRTVLNGLDKGVSIIKILGEP